MAGSYGGPGQPTPYGEPGRYPEWQDPYGYPGQPSAYGYAAPTTFTATDAVAWGWRKFTENLGQVLLGIVLAAVAYAVLLFIGAAPLLFGSSTGQAGQGPTAGQLVLLLVCQLITTVGAMLLGAAWVRAAMGVADGRPFDLIAGARGLPVVTIVLASVITFVLVWIGMIALVLPGILLAFLTGFTLYALTDDPTLTAWGAVQRSIVVVWANFGPVLLLALLNLLIIIAGFILIGLGLLVAGPVVVFANVYAWRRLTGGPVAP